MWKNQWRYAWGCCAAKTMPMTAFLEMLSNKKSRNVVTRHLFNMISVTHSHDDLKRSNCVSLLSLWSEESWLIIQSSPGRILGSPPILHCNRPISSCFSGNRQTQSHPFHLNMDETGGYFPKYCVRLSGFSRRSCLPLTFSHPCTYQERGSIKQHLNSQADYPPYSSSLFLCNVVYYVQYVHRKYGARETAAY